MKPDWKDAPEWAQYLSCDKFGYVWWEHEPVYKNDEYTSTYNKCLPAIPGHGIAKRPS